MNSNPTTRRSDSAVPTRRAALAGLGALALAGAADAGVGPGLRIGLQLYTVSRALEADFDATLAAVGRMGYRDVELAGVYGRTPEQMHRALAAAGLSCVSAHVTAQDLTTDLSGRIGAVRDMGGRWLVLPVPPVPKSAQALTAAAVAPEGPARMAAAFSAMTLDDWRRAADFLNDVGRAAAGAGLRFGYHNHNVEFRPIGSRTGWDVLWAGTDPALVSFEIDLAWIAASGQDPKAFLKAHGARAGLLHLKDLKAAPPNFEMRIQSTEAGAGVQDWPGLLRLAREAGIVQSFVEEEPRDMADPLRSAGLSLDYLRDVQKRIGG